MNDQTSTSRDLRLAAALGQMQTGGWNGFSFRDLAAARGIKSSSVHYHFATKQELGCALLAAYREPVLAVLEGPGDAVARLGAFLDLFRATAHAGDRLCLAGMMASDLTSLGPELRAELAGFFRAVEDRLTVVIGEVSGGGRESGKASLLLSSLEGALPIHRVSPERDALERTIDALCGLIGLPALAGAGRREGPGTA